MLEGVNSSTEVNIDVGRGLPNSIARVARIARCLRLVCRGVCGSEKGRVHMGLSSRRQNSIAHGCFKSDKRGRVPAGYQGSQRSPDDPLLKLLHSRKLVRYLPSCITYYYCGMIYAYSPRIWEELYPLCLSSLGN